MRHIIAKFLYKVFGSYYKYTAMYLKYKYYTLFLLPSIKKRLAKKEKLNILFFVIDLSMWKADALFQELLKDSRYNPIIVSFLYPNQSLEYQKRTQNEMKQSFEAKGYPFVEGYDFDTNTWFDAKLLQPDIIFYNQPYNIGHPINLIEHFWKNSLFIAIPYGFNVDNFPILYNTLLFNIAWKTFVPNTYMIDYTSKIMFNKARNQVYTGHFLFDELKKDLVNPWKKDHPTSKRIIWAPHHSIKSEDSADYSIGYSTFLDIADEMLDIATRYKNVCQFAFKPHPLLRDKLYRQSSWGIKRTDDYFSQWEQMENTFVEEGEYAALFSHSDAMIHDSCSFIADYIYTGKPTMFVSNDKNYIQSTLNEFGKECFRLHYHGSTADIVDFIEDVVIKENDPLSPMRQQFIVDTTPKMSVAKAMKAEIDNLFNQKIWM